MKHAQITVAEYYCTGIQLLRLFKLPQLLHIRRERENIE